MKRMVFYFEKAQSLAPTTALKKSVTAMLKLTKADLTAKNPNKVNFSAASRPVSKWGDAHCPSSESAGFNSFVGSGSSGNSKNSGSSETSGNSGSSVGGKASSTAFCKDVRTVSGDIATLLSTSKDGGTEVSASLLNKAAAAAQHLANEAPSRLKQDAETAARDLKSPNNPNADLVGDAASLSTDYDTDCPGGVAYNGISGNSGNSGNADNSGGFGNSGGSGNSGNS